MLRMRVGVAGRHLEQRLTTSGLMPLGSILSERGENIVVKETKLEKKIRD